MNEIRKSKFLLYYDWHLDLRAGGPPGYLANLRCGLDRIPNPEAFDFELWRQKKQDSRPKRRGWLKRLVCGNRWLDYLDANYFSRSRRKYCANYLSFLENIDAALIQDEVIAKLENEPVRMVHTHYVVDALKVINTLKRIGKRDEIKVILTSHMPEAPALENYKLFREQGYSEEKAQRFKRAWERVQERAFRESDIFVFPSREAMEPYFSTIPEFGDWTQGKDIRFVQTGAMPVVSEKDRQELKAYFHVPEGKKVLVYIGRHIEVKGYDILVRAGRQILSQRDDVLFLIGGRGNFQFKAPKKSGWRELGWVNPADLLQIADGFILPNRQTFFDLVLLEVMSTGTPVIASNTGGNKTVQATTGGALNMYDATPEGLVHAINNFLDLAPNEREKQGRNIRQAYENNYTAELFASRYLDLVKALYMDYGFISDEALGESA